MNLWSFSCYKRFFLLYFRFLMLPVLTTSLLISLRMDLYCLTFSCLFGFLLSFFPSQLFELWFNLLLEFQVSLLTENGNTKDDLRLPTDENLLGQVSWQFFSPMWWKPLRCAIFQALKQACKIEYLCFYFVLSLRVSTLWLLFCNPNVLWF